MLRSFPRFLCAFAGLAWFAGCYQLTSIVDENSAIPGSPGNFITSFGEVAFDGNEVAFTATEPSGMLGVNRALAQHHAAITAVALPGDPAPGYTGATYGNVFNPSIDQGKIAYVATLSGGPASAAVYSDVSGSLGPSVDTTTTPPTGTGTAFTTFVNPSLTNGQLAFLGYSNLGANIDLLNGATLSNLANNQNIIMGDTFNFSFADRFYDSATNTLVFSGIGQNGGFSTAALYSLVNGTLTKLVDFNTAVPGGSLGNFSGFAPQILSGDTVYFTGFNGQAGYAGVFSVPVAGGALTNVIDTNTPAPDDATFTGFAAAAPFGAKPGLLFAASSSSAPAAAGVTGVYALDEFGVHALAVPGMELDGKTVTGTSFTPNCVRGTKAVIQVSLTAGGAFTVNRLYLVERKTLLPPLLAPFAELLK